MSGISIHGSDVEEPKGDLDEVFGFRCTAHLERMSDSGFCLILNAGLRKVIINLHTSSRCKLHAFIFADDTRTSAEEQRSRRARKRNAMAVPR